MARIAGESPRVARYINLSPPGTDEPVILCCEVSRTGGPPVLLVPGLGDTVWVWRHVVPALETHHRVLALEPRGHGRSASPRGPYALGDLAGDLAGVIDRLGARRPVLIAQGLGARAALLHALDRPEQTPALVLIGAAAGPPVGPLRHALAEGRERALAGDMRGAHKARRTAGLEARGLTPKERAERHRIFLRQSAPGYAAACAAELNAPDLTARLGELACPVLLLAGGREEGAREKALHLASAIPDCEAVVVEEAASYPQVERPEATLTLIEEFFRKHNLSVPRAD